MFALELPLWLASAILLKLRLEFRMSLWFAADMWTEFELLFCRDSLVLQLLLLLEILFCRDSLVLQLLLLLEILLVLKLRLEFRSALLLALGFWLSAFGLWLSFGLASSFAALFSVSHSFCFLY